MKYKPENTELDHRLTKKFKKAEISKMTPFEKMKILGKISMSNQTQMNQEYQSSSVFLMYNNLRIEGDSNFPSIFANNCVVSGRWFYEARVITNRLMQIGWVSFII